MRIRATCDSCSHQFLVKETSAGKRVRCPDCGDPVQIPMDDEDQPEAPARKSSSKSRGKGRKQEKNQNGMLIGVGAGVGAVVVIGLLIVGLSGSGNNQLSAPPSMVQPMGGMTAPAMAPSAVPVASHGSQPMPQPAPAMAHAPTASVNQTPSSPTASQPKAAPIATAATPTTETASTTPTSTDDTKKKPATERVKFDMVELIAKVEPSVVRITVSSKQGASTGSGFVVDKDGTIVTNVHVMEGAKKAEVEFANGVTAPVVGYRHTDPKKDIAIIKVDLPPEKLIPVPLATELPPKGTAVVAFGAPHGLSFTTSEGIISALRPADEMKEQFGSEFHGDWIQTSTPISPGNSGGPLVNHYGEVVAMNTMQMTIGQNLNFAMSAIDIAKTLKEAPVAVKPITPDAIKSPPTSRSRSMASDETETDRGRRLFSEITEIFLINATTGKMVTLDPTGQIWKKVINKSKSIVEKSKIELSFGEPSDDAALLFVMLELRTSKKKTVTAGTQELYITAELICKDDFAKKGESKVCRIWKDEENLGTIALAALREGSYPPTVEQNLSKFVNGFRSACNRARQSQKETGKSDKDKSDKDKSDKEKTDKS